MEFIPLAERTGVIGPLSDWVIEEACRQGAEWREQGLDLYVSVNMPPALWQPTAMRHVLKTIEQFGLHAGRRHDRDHRVGGRWPTRAASSRS